MQETTDRQSSSRRYINVGFTWPMFRRLRDEAYQHDVSWTALIRLAVQEHFDRVDMAQGSDEAK